MLGSYFKTTSSFTSCHLLGAQMFSSLFDFQIPNSDVLYFIDPSIDLFPKEFSINLPSSGLSTSLSNDHTTVTSNDFGTSDGLAHNVLPVQES